MTLSMVQGTTGLSGLGLALDSNSDPVTATARSLYNFDALNPAAGFFGVLEKLLQKLPGATVGQMPPLNPGATQQVYEFPVSFSYSPPALPLPFAFGTTFGQIGSASLSGQLNVTASVSANFTLGYDMSASAAPVILSSAALPVPANGQLPNGESVNFSVILNGGTPISIQNALSSTGSNTSVSDLANQLNQAFTGQSTNIPAQGGSNGNATLEQVITARGRGNQISISVQPAFLGIVNTLEVSAKSNDPFVTELGLGSHLSSDGSTAYSIATAPIKGLFIEAGNPTLSGSLLVSTPTPISGSLQLGFVNLSTSGGVVETIDKTQTMTPAARRPRRRRR